MGSKSDKAKTLEQSATKSETYLGSFFNQAQEKELSREFSETSHQPLSLKATDEEDLEIMSSLLQDAIIPATNFHFISEKQQFIIKLNRFCWEDKPHNINGKPIYTRVLTAIEINHVKRVQTQNFDRSAVETYYNLLAILPAQDNADGDTYIELIFAGDARVRITVDDMKIFMIDSQETSYTEQRPDHNQDMQNMILKELEANQNR